MSYDSIGYIPYHERIQRIVWIWIWIVYHIRQCRILVVVVAVVVAVVVIVSYFCATGVFPEFTWRESTDTFRMMHRILVWWTELCLTVLLYLVLVFKKSVITYYTVPTNFETWIDWMTVGTFLDLAWSPLLGSPSPINTILARTFCFNFDD